MSRTSLFVVMPRDFKLWRWLKGAVIASAFAATAAAQAPVPLVIQTIPVGLRPIGIGFASSGNSAEYSVVVANSGENSVTVLNINGPIYATVASVKVVSGISLPFGVSEMECLTGGAIVTSPVNNSVSIVDVLQGAVKATIKVGLQPYSVACSLSSAYVSNYGDNTLSVIDLQSLTITKTIPNVPGNRGLRGVLVAENGLVWVAGSDANVVTLVNPATSVIAASIPVRAPSFIRFKEEAGHVVWVGSLTDNAIYGFDEGGLTIASTVSGIPTPQDFVPSANYFGRLATTGSGNSVARIYSSDSGVTFISGVPGAAGIIGAEFAGVRPLIPHGFMLVTSPESNQVFLLQAQPALPNGSEVANGASFGRGQTAQGLLASVFAATGVSQNFNALSVPLPKTLGGLTLSVGGTFAFDATVGKWNYSSTGAVQAPLLFVGPNQINFQIPLGIAPGNAVPAQLTKPDGTALLTTLNLTATAPGIFSVLQNGQGQGAVLNQDNSQNFGTNPAKRGSVIQIYATGGGETTPSLLPGEAAPAIGNPLVVTNVQPTVTIGGVNAQVLFSGMAPGYVSLWQINAEVPATVAPGSALPLVVTSGGVASNTVTIAVE